MEITVLMAISIAYVLYYELEVHRKWDGYLNFKPFTCPTCLSGWTALVLIIVWDCPLLGVLFQAAGWMCIAMLLSVIVNLLMSKYL